MAKFKKILMIEDDVFIAELYLRAYKKAGYEIDSVLSGTTGLEKAMSGEYDLVLLDIMIPETTGMEVLEQLTQNQANRSKMKIVITTNLEQDDATRTAVEKLADGYVIKANITPKVLVEMTHQLEDSGSIKNED